MHLQARSLATFSSVLVNNSVTETDALKVVADIILRLSLSLSLSLNAIYIGRLSY